MEREFKYHIFPFFDMVRVEIYREYDGLELLNLSKTFGSIFRKPIEQDYLDAEIWAKNQLKYINNANKK
jgi:hypothetical protein